MELLVKLGGGVLSLCNTFDKMGWCSIGWTISSFHFIPFRKHNQEPNDGEKKVDVLIEWNQILWFMNMLTTS
jgi:hypothetical protein